jgi:hypothetical protein
MNSKQELLNSIAFSFMSKKPILKAFEIQNIKQLLPIANKET